MQASRYFTALCRIALLAALVCGNRALPQTPKANASVKLSPEENKSLNGFLKRAKDYIGKEHALPADKLKPTADIAVLDQERQALRQALQQSRPNAKQGDFFTPPIAAVFRKVLAQTLSGHAGAKIKASLSHAEPTAPTKLVVNSAYPNADGQPIQSVPPTLLLNLPVLPKGLEYCLAGKTLALRDTDANMVVDILPNALP
jgi:hypothetical protein